MNRKISMFFFLAIICLHSLHFPSFADDRTPPKEGSKVPFIKLHTPETLEERTYLGIEQEGFFTIPSIKADVVIVYFFSLYCRFCALQSPVINDLYYAIDKDPDLKKKIKIIGIGIGNTAMEVDAYKDETRLLFPLIPDPDFSVHKAYGEITTPHFFVVRIRGDGRHKIVYSTYAFNDVKEFLGLILKKSELAE